MKKILISIITIVLIFSLCSCHKHEFAPATCTEPAKCSCGETHGDPLGHSFTEPTCTEAAKCTVCGQAGDAAYGHEYISGTATYQHGDLCARCEEYDTNVLTPIMEQNGLTCETDINKVYSYTAKTTSEDKPTTGSAMISNYTCTDSSKEGYKHLSFDVTILFEDETIKKEGKIVFNYNNLDYYSNIKVGLKSYPVQWNDEIVQIDLQSTYGQDVWSTDGSYSVTDHWEGDIPAGYDGVCLVFLNTCLTYSNFTDLNQPGGFILRLPAAN